jgi:hypothetical protein
MTPGALYRRCDRLAPLYCLLLTMGVAVVLWLVVLAILFWAMS